MLCRSCAWRACRCCNAPGSQMSWCGSDLRLSLGIEPPVAIWKKGGSCCGTSRSRNIMATDPGEVCERDGSNKGRWQEATGGRWIRAPPLDGEKKSKNQRNPDERAPARTQADQRRQPGNAREPVGTAKHSSARSSINSLLTCWLIERRFDPTSIRYSVTINFISGLGQKNSIYLHGERHMFTRR